jgi:hypothetical protein
MHSREVFVNSGPGWVSVITRPPPAAGWLINVRCDVRREEEAAAWLLEVIRRREALALPRFVERLKMKIPGTPVRMVMRVDKFGCHWRVKGRSFTSRVQADNHALDLANSHVEDALERKVMSLDL